MIPQVTLHLSVLQSRHPSSRSAHRLRAGVKSAVDHRFVHGPIQPGQGQRQPGYRPHQSAPDRAIKPVGEAGKNRRQADDCGVVNLVNKKFAVQARERRWLGFLQRVCFPRTPGRLEVNPPAPHDGGENKGRRKQHDRQLFRRRDSRPIQRGHSSLQIGPEPRPGRRPDKSGPDGEARPESPGERS